MILKRDVVALAIWTLGGSSLAFAQTPARIPQKGAPPTSVTRQPAAPPLQPAPTAAQQMTALERRAKFDMICYRGRVSDDGVATVQKELRSLALIVKAPRAK